MLYEKPLLRYENTKWEKTFEKHMIKDLYPYIKNS